MLDYQLVCRPMVRQGYITNRWAPPGPEEAHYVADVAVLRDTGAVILLAGSGGAKFITKIVEGVHEAVLPAPRFANGRVRTGKHTALPVVYCSVSGHCGNGGWRKRCNLQTLAIE
jgi:hypothetical protein